jgi:Zn-dependent peptidase ImmA (M78 family)
MHAAGGTMTAAHLIMLAQFFDVSFRALTQRLEELGRVTRGTYELLHAQGFKPRDAERALGLEQRAPAERLPFRYTFLVASLYARGVLSEGDAAAYLHTDRLSAREMLQAIREPGGEPGTSDSAGFDVAIEVTN